MKQVLVVDDNPDSRQILCSVLSMEGFRAQGAGSGEDALRVIAGEPPNAVVLDLLLPRMNGLDVLRELKSRPSTAGIPVVVLTAKDDEQTREQVLARGAAGFLGKPAEPGDVVRKLRKVLGESLMLG